MVTRQRALDEVGISVSVYATPNRNHMHSSMLFVFVKLALLSLGYSSSLYTPFCISWCARDAYLVRKQELQHNIVPMYRVRFNATL